MNSNPFSNLNFNRQPRVRLTPRTIFVALALLAYLIAWWILPSSALFWLGLFVIVGLVWMASYGWREALQAIHLLIHRLEIL